MSYFFLGCAILAGLLLLGRLVLRADPKKLAGVLRKVGAIVLFALAGLLAVRGAFPLAIPLAALALGLLGGRSLFPGGFGGSPGSAQQSKGQASKVRTERLEMQLDHDSGHMDGTCLTGNFEGRKLSSLSDREVVELYLSFEADRLKEADLLEAYLNWRIPDWQDRAGEAQDQAEQAKDQAGAKGFAKGRMSLEEARAVLEVTLSASEAEIRAAHRRLMKKLHPDHGGSNYLAARINEAKDVLLGS